MTQEDENINIIDIKVKLPSGKTMSCNSFVHRIIDKTMDENFVADKTTKRLAESIIHAYLDSQSDIRLNAIMVITPDIMATLTHLIYVSIKTFKNIERENMAIVYNE